MSLLMSTWVHSGANELRLADKTMSIVQERRELRGSERLLLLAGIAKLVRWKSAVLS